MIVALDDWRTLAKLKMLIQKRVKRGPRDRIVVMGKMLASLQKDVVFFAVETVKRL